MAWLSHATASQGELRARFDGLLRQAAISQAVGVYNALSARLAADAGFSLLYLSGAALSASRCLPDIGLLDISELAHATRDLVRASNLPLIVDADTGGGSVIGAARAARELQDAGAAAIQLEDQLDPKRCGHLAGKRLIAAEEMVARIRAARKAAPSIAIVARSDARAVEGMDSLLARCRAYVDAGADCVFPEALPSRGEFAAVAAMLTAPLLANMTEFGVSPLLTAQELQSMGYRIVIHPVSLLRVAAYVTRELLSDTLNTGTTNAWLERMQSRAELYATLRYDAYAALEDAAYADGAHGPGEAAVRQDAELR